MELTRQNSETKTFSKKTGYSFGTKSTSPFFAPVNIQPKLTIGPVDDPYEREADAMAEHVMRMPVQQNAEPNFIDNKTTFFSPKPVSPFVQRACSACEEEKIQRKEDKPEEGFNPAQHTEKFFDTGFDNIDNTVQRKCDYCEEEEKLQMKSEGGASAGMQAPSIIHDVLNSGGQPLDAGARSFFEPRFGYDFSNVKIHTGSHASASSRAINAHAYTSGNNIVFNEGKFAPNTEGGKRLLAHELTHVVQQSGRNTSIQKLPSWDDIKEGAEGVLDKAEGGLASFGDSVSSGIDEVKEFIYTEAGVLAMALANTLLSKYGGSIKILEGGGIELHLPNVPVLNRYSKSFPWDASTPEKIFKQVPIELGEFGLLFLTLFVKGQIHAAVTGGIGPVMLKDIVLTISPKENYYSGEATVSAPADINGMLELTGIIGGAGNWNCFIEVFKIEGGLSGMGRAGTSTTLEDKAFVTYQNGEFNFDNKLTLANCLQFTFDLNALVNLSIVEQPLWSGQWNLINWPWEKCWSILLKANSNGDKEWGGGGGESGGGGASGSWDDGPPSDGAAFGGGGSSDSYSLTSSSLSAKSGEINTPKWDAIELIDSLFSHSTFTPQIKLPIGDETKEKVQRACPIKKDNSKKTFAWKTPHNKNDMNGVLTYSTSRDGAEFTTHAHHVWPKNIGGPEKQTRLNVIQTIHLNEIHGTGGVHSFLSASLSNEMGGEQITRFKSDKGNQRLIEKMRFDMTLRRKVYKLLEAFYKRFRDQSYPELPQWTYLTGLDESVNNITA